MRLRVPSEGGKVRRHASWASRGIRRVLGMMSGTSLDGVDCVVVEWDARGGMTLGRHWRRAFPRRLREPLAACASGEASAWECGQSHHDLGRFYARVAADGLGRERVDAVGLHGQTVFHRGAGRAKATLQIGEPAYLAQALGVPVVSNFRANDLAAGGQGAPLATLFHVRVFGQRGRHVCVQNLGGIGNVTSMDDRGDSGSEGPRVLAFDTGPGNMLLDEAVRRLTNGRSAYDREGRWASRGQVDRGMVERCLRHGFFRQKPPKSTGRELFGSVFFDPVWGEMERAALSLEDRLATLTEVTALSVVMNYRLHLPSLPDRVVVCGGGARNRTLMARLEAGLNASGRVVEVVTCAQSGWPPETIEGAAFALLAYERLAGRPGHLPETTGAGRKVLCGQVTEA